MINLDTAGVNGFIANRFSGNIIMTSILLIAAVVLWGLSFVATKLCLELMSPPEIIAGRIVLALIVLGIIARFKRLSFVLLKRRWKLLLASAMILVVHLLIQVEGMKTTTATNTAWLITTIPVFIAVLSYLFLGEKMTPRQIGGIIVATFGVLVLVSRGNLSSLEFIKSYGDWLVLASCLTWSIYTILGKRLEKENPLAVAIMILATTAIVIVPPVLTTSGWKFYFKLPAVQTIALLFLGIFCLGLSYWFWFEGLKRISAGRVGTYLYLEPLSTMLAAPYFLDESITSSLLIGGILVIFGVWLVQYNKALFSKRGRV